MTFEQLKYFAEVVQQKSINKGAKISNLSYQAMLKSINNLELELDMALLYRNKKGISLTPEGKIFYEDVQNIFKMQEKWTAMAKKKMPKFSNITIYGTLFITDNHAMNIKKILTEQNFSVNYSPCFDDVIERLIKAQGENKEETIFLTCNSLSGVSIQQLAENNGFICENISRDYFCAYINRTLLKKRYGRDNVERISSDDLRTMLSIRLEDYRDRLFYYNDLPNKNDLIVSATSTSERFSILRKLEGYVIYNKSVQEKVEKKYPYLKGVEIKDFAPRIYYYIIYNKEALQDTLYAVELIKGYFNEINKHD